MTVKNPSTTTSTSLNLELPIPRIEHIEKLHRRDYAAPLEVIFLLQRFKETARLKVETYKKYTDIYYPHGENLNDSH